jgi:hypothetical protein
LPERELRLAQDAVERVVTEKIEAFLGSRGRAGAFAADAAKGRDAA